MRFKIVAILAVVLTSIIFIAGVLSPTPKEAAPAEALIHGSYNFSSIQQKNNDSTLVSVDPEDKFHLAEDSSFQYNLKGKNNLEAHGQWSRNDNKLTLKYSLPSDTVRNYTILVQNDTALLIEENGVLYAFSRAEKKITHFSSTTTNTFSLNHFGRGLMGLLILIVVGYIFSNNRRAINWRQILVGIGIQLVIAYSILHLEWVEQGFESVSALFVKLLGFTREGSLFLFGSLVENTDSFGYIFAFQVLPTVVFFSALTSLLYYYNILQKVVYVFAWLMRNTMKLSGAESLAAAGNIFLGQTEAPLLVKPYIGNMTKSELLCLMSGGMATIAGGVLAAYISYLGDGNLAQEIYFAKHLLAASVMSAPAAIVAAKLLVPETQNVAKEMRITSSSIGKSWLEAIANGTTEGLKLAVNVGAMLLVFTAFIYMFNSILSDFIGANLGLNDWVVEFTDGQYTSFSLQFILGYTLAPFTWLMGVDGPDIYTVGQLLGEKTILNEFYAYASMAQLLHDGQFIYSRSAMIATYILCGFANFASIGIQIGGIGALATNRKSELSKLGIRALIAGTMASLFTAVLVGMLT